MHGHATYPYGVKINHKKTVLTAGDFIAGAWPFVICSQQPQKRGHYE